MAGAQIQVEQLKMLKQQTLRSATGLMRADFAACAAGLSGVKAGKIVIGVALGINDTYSRMHVGQARAWGRLANARS